LEELKDEDGWDEPRLRGKLIDSTVTLIVSSNGGVQRTSGQVVDTGGFFSDAPYVRLLGAKGFKDVPIEEIQAVFGMKTYHF
jgi:hypothetical protein